MFWPFVDVHGRLEYCPLADFGGVGLCEGAEISANVVLAEPITGHEEFRNGSQFRGRVALLQRGECDFVTKVLRAQRAGAIAVLVGNSRTEVESDNDGAFVMDAGSRGRHLPEEVAEIRVPAMMMSFNMAKNVFQQARTAMLEGREFLLSIKFLGAKRAAWVLEQREKLNSSVKREENARQKRLEREARRSEAASVLRTRLAGAKLIPKNKTMRRMPSVSGSYAPSCWSSTRSFAAMSDMISDVSSVRSEVFTERQTAPLRRSELEAELLGNNFDEVEENETNHSGKTDASHSSTSSVDSGHQEFFANAKSISQIVDMNFESAEFPGEGNQSMAMSVNSSGSALHPWCPMTTALVIIDVQNQFALYEIDKKSSKHRHRSANLCGKDKRFRYAVENEMIPLIHDVLLAGRACEGIEIMYSVVESATRDGRERAPAYKRAGIHVTRGGFGAQIPTSVAPDTTRDFVLSRPGIK